MAKYKVGDLVRVTEKYPWGTQTEPTQIWKIVKVNSETSTYEGRIDASYQAVYHSGFPVSGVGDSNEDYDNYIFRDHFIRKANTGKNQYTEKETETMEERYTLTREERYTLNELKEMGLINDDSLETILVNDIKNLIKEKRPDVYETIKGIDTLAIKVDGIDTFKKVKGLINTVAELV